MKAGGTACQPGTFYCSGTTAWTCRQDGSGYDKKSCPGGCANNKCIEQACAPGQRQCQSSRTLKVCRNDGSGWSMQTCPVSCQNGQCVNTQTCQANQTVCTNQKTLGTCKPDGSGYTLATCPVLCENGKCVNSCSPGVSTCRDAKTLQTCNANGTGYQTQVCANGCQNNQCKGATCTPGTRRCNPEPSRAQEIQQCAYDGSGWKDTGQKCQDVCNNGQCVTQACTRNEIFCDGKDIKKCNAQGTGATTQESCDFGCSTPSPELGPVCHKCEQGKGRCNGDNVEACNDPVTGYENLGPCPDGKVCAAGTCIGKMTFPEGLDAHQTYLHFSRYGAACMLSPTAGSENVLCYSMDTTNMAMDIDLDDMHDWWCDAGVSEADFPELDGHDSGSLYNAADDLQGCGWDNLNDFNFSDDGKVRKGKPLGHYCMFHDPGGGMFDYEEVYVVPCSEFRP